MRRRRFRRNSPSSSCQGRSQRSLLVLDERGAEIVELAIVATLLFAVLLAIIDFGYAFGQNLDVKNGAREGARLAAVSADSNTSASTNCSDIVSAIKTRMSDTTSSNVKVYMTYSGSGLVANADTLTVTVSYPRSSLTGFTTALIGGYMHSTVTMRLEQDANWGKTSPATYSPGVAVSC